MSLNYIKIFIILFKPPRIKYLSYYFT